MTNCQRPLVRYDFAGYDMSYGVNCDPTFCWPFNLWWFDLCTWRSLATPGAMSLQAASRTLRQLARQQQQGQWNDTALAAQLSSLWKQVAATSSRSQPGGAGTNSRSMSAYARAGNTSSSSTSSSSAGSGLRRVNPAAGSGSAGDAAASTSGGWWTTTGGDLGQVADSLASFVAVSLQELNMVKWGAAAQEREEACRP